MNSAMQDRADRFTKHFVKYAKDTGGFTQPTPEAPAPKGEAGLAVFAAELKQKRAKVKEIKQKVGS